MHIAVVVETVELDKVDMEGDVFTETIVTCVGCGQRLSDEDDQLIDVFFEHTYMNPCPAGPPHIEAKSVSRK